MNDFFKQWLHRPDGHRTRLMKFTEGCGFLYLFIGSTFFFFPNLQVQIGLIPAFQGQEEALLRFVGMTLAIIGYFYIFGARTNIKSFGLSTVVDRLLIPFLILFVFSMSEINLMLVLPFAILDPTLAVIAYMLWRKDEKDSRST
jgi:hypothetical protein